MNNAPISITQEIVTNAAARREIVKRSHYYFFHIYFAEGIKHKTAPFQKEILELTQSTAPEHQLFSIVAFRGSGKTTIVGESFPLWSILGEPQRKFILILVSTKERAQMHLQNIKDKLENNKLLKADLGPFKEFGGEWKSHAIELPKMKARIMVGSKEQAIRGLKSYSSRPDLVICDDIDDLQSVRFRETRENRYKWFTSEVLPIGDKDTRFVMIGNLLHQDSLMSRIKKEIEEGKRFGTHIEYPLTDKDGNIMWPGKYPSHEAIERERKKIGNDVTFEREYNLRIISSETQIVKHEWIQYYDEVLIFIEHNDPKILICVDPAISEKNTADNTAILVIMWGYKYKNRRKIQAYVHPTMFNEKMSYPKLKDTLITLYENFRVKYRTEILVEDVGFQRALIEELKGRGLTVTGFSIGSSDKASRLHIATDRIKDGSILFHSKASNELVEQLVDFGVERYDDLADAFSMACLHLNKKSYCTARALRKKR